MPVPATAVADARRLNAEGRFHAAASLLLDAFREDPTDATVARELGATMRASGDLGASINYLERAHQIDPIDVRTVAELVLSYHGLQRHEDASQLLIRCLARGLSGESLAAHLRDAA